MHFGSMISNQNSKVSTSQQFPFVWIKYPCKPLNFSSYSSYPRMLVNDSINLFICEKIRIKDTFKFK